MSVPVCAWKGLATGYNLLVALVLLLLFEQTARLIFQPLSSFSKKGPKNWGRGGEGERYSHWFSLCEIFLPSEKQTCVCVYVRWKLNQRVHGEREIHPLSTLSTERSIRIPAIELLSIRILIEYWKIGSIPCNLQTFGSKRINLPRYNTLESPLQIFKLHWDKILSPWITSLFTAFPLNSLL